MTHRTRIVEAARPKTTLVASGMRICAWRLFSARRGNKPAMVVREVNNTARNRSRLASKELLKYLNYARAPRF